MRILIVLACLLTAGLVGAPDALAHKVIASTYVTGDTIEGEIGFSDGSMAEDTPVTVVAPDGRVLGETRTDGDGFFSFTPTEAVEHIFKTDLGAGHLAEAHVPVADLPDSVTGGVGAGGGAATAAAAPSPAPRPTGGDEGAQLAAAPTLTPAMEEAIATAVRDEVRPLWRELSSYKEKNDLQSILGGIGYIVGVFGVGFYLVARQRLKRA